MTLSFKASLHKYQSFIEVLTVLNLSTFFSSVFCWKSAFELYQQFECRVFPLFDHFHLF